MWPLIRKILTCTFQHHKRSRVKKSTRGPSWGIVCSTFFKKWDWRKCSVHMFRSPCLRQSLHNSSVVIPLTCCWKRSVVCQESPIMRFPIDQMRFLFSFLTFADKVGSCTILKTIVCTYFVKIIFPDLTQENDMFYQF